MGKNSLFQTECSYRSNKAKKMNLFISHELLHPIDFDILKFQTPLGELFFDCELVNTSIMNVTPIKIEGINSSPIIASWSFDSCYIEFLRSAFIPKLLKGMQVDQCFCGIWRVKAFKEMNFNFKCYLNKKNNSLQGSPEPGQGLIAQSFEDNGIKLTIGTENEEEIQNRAKINNWLPTHFQSEIESDHIQYLLNGLKVTLPPLMKTEQAQIHFTVAWNSLRNPEVSTWYAVDQSIQTILKQTNID